MNQKAHRLRWALFFDCSSELNSEIVNSGSVRFKDGYIQYTFDDGTTWVNWQYVGTGLQILPVMTSATSDMGTVSKSGNVVGTAYNAIDGTAGRSSAPYLNDINAYIAFTFAQAQHLSKISVVCYNNHSSQASYPRLDYSLNGSTWIEGTVQTLSGGDLNDYVLEVDNINEDVKAIRVYDTSASGSCRVYKIEAFR